MDLPSSGSFSCSHVSAASTFANTLRCLGPGVLTAQPVADVESPCLRGLNSQSNEIGERSYFD
jgi:hypothetical protein